MNDIFIFDFDNTLVKHSNGVPILADIKDAGQLIKGKIVRGHFLIITPEETIDENNIKDDDYYLKVEPKQYENLLKMFNEIKENPNNIIIILSRGVEKLIELFFKNKLSDLEPFFILGANNYNDIGNGRTYDDQWAKKKGRAINYIYDFTEANIMFYDDTKENIKEVEQNANNKQKIKAIEVKNYTDIYDIYIKSLKSLNTT